jgi:Skp family chaperone for outer membrane proteins
MQVQKLLKSGLGRCLLTAADGVTCNIVALSLPKPPNNSCRAVSLPLQTLSSHFAAAAALCICPTPNTLDSWNQETATARQEIARTQKALKDIQTNIHKVQSSVAAEDTAFKAAAEAAQLEQQLEQQVQELLQGLQQRQEQLVQQLQDRRHEEQQLQVRVHCCKQTAGA